jgi:signal transduction histidine kinase/tetratricopeptide (TPR) repeat protein/tRNA A-37 threonylcarbamoyl transferase component Bud32
VWKAVDTLENREVAVKLLTSHGMEDLSREFRLASELRHPHIARVYDLGRSESGAPFLAMQLLRAQPLDRAAEGRSLADLLEWIAQVLSALHALHVRGLVHADVKPSNILVEPDGSGHAYLSDFGLARPTEGALGVSGTPAYVAPECIEGQAADVRSDLYSLGVTLYEVITGQQPFAADTLAETLKRHLTVSPPNLAVLRPEVSPALAQFVERLMSKAANARFQSPAAALAALDALSGAELGARSEPRWLEPPLIGRDHVVAALAVQREALQAGRGGVVWISARAGMGASVLAEHAVQCALVDGLRVGRATCRPGADPWDPLLRAARAALGAPFDAAWAQVQSPDTCSPQVAVNALMQCASDPGSNEGSGGRAAPGESSPGQNHLLLVFDDAHEAHPHFWTALALLVQEAQDRPIGVVFTESADSAAHAGLVARIELAWSTAERNRCAQRIDLESLTSEQARDLLAGTLGLPVCMTSLVEPIFRASQGRPGLVLQLVRLVAREGCLVRTETGWKATIPSRLLEILSRNLADATWALDESRLLGMEPLCIEVARALAVVSTSASPAALAYIVGTDIDQVHGALDALASAGLATVSVDGGSRQGGLSRSGFAAWIARAIIEEHARELHTKCGEAYELGLLSGPTAVTSLIERGIHLARGGDWRRALDAALSACDESGLRGTPPALNELVDTLLERAFQLQCDVPDWEARLLKARGEAYFSEGRYADALQSVELARLSAGDVPGLLAQLGSLSVQALAHLGRRNDAEAALEGARKALASSEPAAIVPLDWGQYWFTQAYAQRLFGEPDRSRAAAYQGLELLEGEPDTPAVLVLRSRLLYEVATADFNQSQLESARKNAALAEGYGALAGSPGEVARAAMAEGNALRQLGQLPQAILAYEKARDVAASCNWAAMAGKCANNIAICHYLAGRWSEAGGEWKRAVRFADLSGDRNEKVILLNNLGYLYLERGALDKADTALTEAVDLSKTLGSDRVCGAAEGNLGELRLRQGRAAEARSAYGRAQDRLRRVGAMADLVELGRRMAELFVDQNRWDDAQIEAEKALASAEELAVVGEAARLCGVAAVAAANLGETEQARTLLERGAKHLAQAEPGQLEPTILNLHRGWVAAVLGDVDEARTLLDGAKARFRELGALWLERDCDKVLALLRGRALTENSRADSANPAEGGLWDLVAMALTSDDVKHLAREILRPILAVTGAARGTLSIQTFRELEGFTVTVDRFGKEPKDDGADPYSRTVALTVLDTGQEIVVENVLDNECLAATESVMAMNLQSVLCMPVVVLGQPRGILYVDSQSFIGERLQAARPQVRAVLAAFGGALERNIWRRRFEAQRELASQVSHELRSPVSSIIGFVQLASEAAPPSGYGDTIDELLSVVAGEANRMNHLVRSMTELWLHHSTAALRFERRSARELAERVALALRPTAQKLGIELVVDIPSNLPDLFVAADELQQVFTNLVQNALRHTPGGRRIWLRAELDTAPVSLGERPRCILEVRDEGEGLSQEDQARVFRKFDRGSRPSGEGSGLGLTICQNVVANHGGRIWVESELGQGARFRFTVATAGGLAEPTRGIEADPRKGIPAISLVSSGGAHVGPR